MKKTIDLTNYENFYKTPDELETLRKKLYRLANEADWNAWTNTSSGWQIEEYLDFVDVEQDENSIDYDDEELSELDKKLLGSHSLKSDLTIDELIYFIEKANEKRGRWVFAYYDKKSNELIPYPEYLHPSELKKLEYDIWEFEFPSDDEEEE